MTRRFFFACVSLLLLSLSGMPAMAGNFSVAGIDNDDEAYAFLNGLQTALKANDRLAIAGMLAKGLHVYRDGKLDSKTAQAAMARFDEVFDPYVMAVVLCQTPGGLWANWRGISIGRGTVWFGLELQVSRKAYDAAPQKYPSSDRRYWKMKVLTINMGRYAEEQSARCP